MESESRYQITRRVTLVGATVNCILAGLQIIFGIIGHSQALLADGIHTLSDLSTDMIVLLASGRAAKEADEDHPFGHGRIETLATLLLAAILALVGAGIGFGGFESILNPEQPDIQAITLLFAALAIVAKEGLYRYTIKAARQCHSSLLESNALHHRSDALSSIVVLIGIAGQLVGFPYMDAIAAMIVGLMIIIIGLGLGKKALSELIDTGLDAELVADIRHSMLGDRSVEAVHTLRTRSMGGLGYVDAEVLVNPRLTVSEAHYIAFQLEQMILEKFSQIADVQIHIDPLSETGHESVTNLPAREDIENDLEQVWRLIPRQATITRINLHYLNQVVEVDLVLPIRFNQAIYAEEVDQLMAQTRQLNYVGTVNLYFER
ncbi:MAG: cation diffusion facilitator family transporter [Planctomycetota bacterium]|jgi:cation diffusion facilitator family transporter